MNTIKKFGAICALVGALAGCGKQNVSVPYAERHHEVKVWLTRCQRIEISYDKEGNEQWYSEPHDRDGYFVRVGGTTTTTYFKDGRISFYDWNRFLTWDYGPEGTIMTDHLGNSYKVEGKTK